MNTLFLLLLSLSAVVDSCCLNHPDKPDLPLEIPTADKVDTDVDTLNEQTTNGYYWVSCNCGLQGIWVPQWQGAYCPSQNMGNGTIQSTYWFAFNNTVNGQAPSGGDIWYYDHASMNTGTFPTGYHTVEVVPGSISPSTNNTTPLIGLDFNSCTCGNDCPISSCDTNAAFYVHALCVVLKLICSAFTKNLT